MCGSGSSFSVNTVNDSNIVWNLMINTYNYMKYHSHKCDEADVTACCLWASGVDSWVLKQALPVLQLSKNAAEAQSSLSAPPFCCFVHPLRLWKKLSLSRDQSFLKTCGWWTLSFKSSQSVLRVLGFSLVNWFVLISRFLCLGEFSLEII